MSSTSRLRQGWPKAFTKTLPLPFNLTDVVNSHNIHTFRDRPRHRGLGEDRTTSVTFFQKGARSNPAANSKNPAITLRSKREEFGIWKQNRNARPRTTTDVRTGVLEQDSISSS